MDIWMPASFPMDEFRAFGLATRGLFPATEFSSMSSVSANGADFDGANLASASLDSAVLKDAIGLSEDQLDLTAAGRGAESLPPGLRAPPQWNRPLNGPTRLRM
jgi:hypothetical protein